MVIVIQVIRDKVLSAILWTTKEKARDWVFQLWAQAKGKTRQWRRATTKCKMMMTMMKKIGYLNKFAKACYCCIREIVLPPPPLFFQDSIPFLCMVKCLLSIGFDLSRCFRLVFLSFLYTSHAWGEWYVQITQANAQTNLFGWFEWKISLFFYQAADKNYTAFGKKSSEPTYRQYLSIRIPSDMFVR